MTFDITQIRFIHNFDHPSLLSLFSKKHESHSLCCASKMTSSTHNASFSRQAFLLTSLCLLCWMPQQALAFLINGNLPLPDIFQKAFVPKKDLQEIQESFLHTVLDMHLDITALPVAKTSSTTTKSSHLLTQRPDQEPRIAIRNLIVELQDPQKNPPSQVVGFDSAGVMKSPKSKLPSLQMPGWNGPHPMSSSGIGPLQIHESGHFITVDMGKKYLPIDTTSTATNAPQWELIWKEQSPAGVLVCGLALPEEVTRNQGMLPKGTMYISFPVWDSAQLLEYQQKKRDCEVASKLHMKERDDELLKMSQTNNVLAKIIHYRNAFAAVEQYSLQPRKMLSHVPSSDDEILPIAGNIVLSRKGQVRIVPDKLRHQPNDSGVARGTALIRPPVALAP
jgi:hypothetical protein